MEKETLYEYTRQIRDFFDTPRQRYMLYQNRASWLQLFSSLDVIGDTELAIAAYSAGAFDSDDGLRYLALYGLLQALFLQQDAIFHSCEAVGMPEKVKNYPKLEYIRGIRNMSIGHPTKKDLPKSEPTSYHFISRITISPEGFQFSSYTSAGKPEFVEVSTTKIIREQKDSLSEILVNTIKKLEEQDALHKEKFKMKNLSKIFENLYYHIGNVFLGIGSINRPIGIDSSNKSIGIVLVDLQQINEALDIFQQEITERGTSLETYSLNQSYEDISYAYSKVEVYLESLRDGREPNINEKDANIYMTYIEKIINELKRTAEEIDEDYSS